MPELLKAAGKRLFHAGGGTAWIRRRHRDALRILMYHRFHHPVGLERQCAHLRRYYQPVSMTAIAGWLHDARSLPPNAVGVTVDDGYEDFEQAAPVFARYGIPVTVYLVTDFLDRKLWLWFDRFVYAFRQTRLPAVDIATPEGLLHVRVTETAGQQLADKAVYWSEAERARLSAELPRLLQVEIPGEPPPESRPLTWDAVRRLAGAGVEFGAHTKTHPILSAVTEQRALLDEIAGSKARIEAELNRPVLHFCYPNGKMRDIGAAAEAAVREAGMRTAVTAERGLNRAGNDPFLLRRIGADPDHEQSYFERSVAGLGLQ